MTTADPTRRRSIALVANTKAGGLLGRDAQAPTWHDALQRAGFDIVPIAEGALPDRLAQARACGADHIVVAGGDGTIACAAKILAGSGTELRIVPAGTMNLLARDLRIPAGDAPAAIAILRDGAPRDIDAAELNGEVFLCAAMLGTPAQLGHHREEARRRGNGLAGWLYFARAFLRAVRRHRALTLRVTVAGKTQILRTPSLTITVNALNDETGQIFARDRLDGGMLCVYAVRHRSAMDLLRLLFNTLRGRIASDPSVTVLRGPTVRIETSTAALRVLIDGEERLLHTPLQARIMPRALRVIAPAI